MASVPLTQVAKERNGLAWHAVRGTSAGRLTRLACGAGCGMRPDVLRCENLGQVTCGRCRVHLGLLPEDQRTPAEILLEAPIGAELAAQQRARAIKDRAARVATRRRQELRERLRMAADCVTKAQELLARGCEQAAMDQAQLGSRFLANQEEDDDEDAA